MDDLIELLLHLVQKVPYLSESDLHADIERLRRFEQSVNNGVSRIVPPAAVDLPGPVATPSVPVPGPVAEPVPANEQTPPPISPDLGVGEIADGENTNAFSGVAPDAAT
jgi:hypothetical protein